MATPLFKPPVFLSVCAFLLGTGLAQPASAQLKPILEIGRRPFTHPTPISRVAISPDATQVISLSGRNQLFSWKINGEPLPTRREDALATFTAMGFSSKGKYIGYRSGGSVWFSPARKDTDRFRGPMHGCASFYFSRDERTLFISGVEGTARVEAWDIATKAKRLILDTGKPEAQVRDIIYSPERDLVALACGNDTIEIWNSRQKRLVHVLEGYRLDTPGRDFVFSPDGAMVAVVGRSQLSLTGIHLFDTATAKLVRHLHLRPDSIAFSPDSKTLAVASHPGQLRFFDLASAKVNWQVDLSDHGIGFATSLAFSQNGRVLAVGMGRHIRLWNLTTRKEITAGPSPAGVLRSLTLLDGGKTLATTSGDNFLRLWDARTGKRKLEMQRASNRRDGIALSHDGKILATQTKKTEIVLWDVVSGKHLGDIAHEKSFALRLPVFSPDGKFLICEDLLMMDVATGQPLPYIRGFNYGRLPFLVSPDGRTLAISAPRKLEGPNGQIVLWDVYAGKEIGILSREKKFDGIPALYYSLSFSPDGATLAAGCMDKAIRVWDVRKRKLIKKIALHEHYGRILVQFSADGKRLIWGSRDSTRHELNRLVHILDLPSCKEIAQLEAPEGGVSFFACSGDRLAAGGADNSIRVWDLASIRKSK